MLHEEECDAASLDGCTVRSTEHDHLNGSVTNALWNFVATFLPLPDYRLHFSYLFLYCSRFPGHIQTRTANLILKLESRQERPGDSLIHLTRLCGGMISRRKVITTEGDSPERKLQILIDKDTCSQRGGLHHSANHAPSIECVSLRENAILGRFTSRRLKISIVTVKISVKNEG